MSGSTGVEPVTCREFPFLHGKRQPSRRGLGDRQVIGKPVGLEFQLLRVRLVTEEGVELMASNVLEPAKHGVCELCQRMLIAVDGVLSLVEGRVAVWKVCYPEIDTTAPSLAVENLGHHFAAFPRLISNSC